MQQIMDYEELAENQLTCLAIPKSANFTVPSWSTSIFAPLISLYNIKDY
jgi:hypothetical protein